MFKKILNRTTSMLIILATLLSLFAFIPTVSATSGNDLGSVSECRFDKNRSVIDVKGSIKYSEMVENRNAKVALYSFLPWENPDDVLSDKSPLALIDMTIRFEFSLPIRSVSEKLSLYAVAIVDDNGVVRLIDKPRMVEGDTLSTSNVGFKGVSTKDSSDAVAAGASMAVIDIYLDKLDKGNKSGYIFTVDNNSFFFDREYITEIDKQVLAYHASGSDVFFRYLISEGSTPMSFSSLGLDSLADGGFAVNNENALLTLYAYSYFLASRYSSSNHGKIRGIMLDSSADLRGTQQDDYVDYSASYARTLSIVAIASIEAVGDKELSFVVPVSDKLLPNKTCFAYDFLSTVSRFLEEKTDISFTVMCESTHNPYKITDSMLDSEIDPDDNVSDQDYPSTPTTDKSDNSSRNAGETTGSREPDGESSDISVSTNPDNTGNLAPDDATQVEPIEPPEPEEPTMNDLSDGYFCTDTIDVFSRMVRSLSKLYTSVNSGFGWSWSPDSRTLGSALGVCYSYNFAKLSAVDTDFFVLNLKNEALNVFPKISHQFKLIDTDKTEEITQYAKAVFGVDFWSEIISGYTSEKMKMSVIKETKLTSEKQTFLGNCDIWNYTQGSGSKKWYAGFNCHNVSFTANKNSGALKAEFVQSESFGKYADIGLICDEPEPLLYGDALGLDILCGEDDGSLYELSVVVYCDEFRVESSVVIEGGERTELLLDTATFSNTSRVYSIRLCVKRVTGEGDYDLSLYKVTSHSNNYSSAALKKIIDEARATLRTDGADDSDSIVATVIISITLISMLAVVLILVAATADKKHKKDEKNE